MKTLFLFFSTLLFAKNIYIASVGGLEADKLFYDPCAYRDGSAKPFTELRIAFEKAGYTVRFTDTAENLEDLAAFISLMRDDPIIQRNLTSVPRNKCLFLIFESPLIQPKIYKKNYLLKRFGKVFTLAEDQVDNIHFFKLNYVQPHMKMVDSIPDFSQKKFAALVSSNKNSDHPASLYRERHRVIEFYASRQSTEFDLYGPDWYGTTNWRGYCESKWETLKNYKFNYCYENFKTQPGYITEKIFDSMVAGCVPIYWGAPNITDYVPKKCFIDRRDFSSNEQLYDYLKSMSRETYEGYIQAIRDFFDSPQAHLFSIEYFIDQILTHVKACESL
jgi:hypothetical protein